MKYKKLSSEKKQVMGAALLIAGCCIGGGMLGLPVVSAASGFLPSTLIMLLAALFMTATGLLILEATLWFPYEVSLITLAKESLGSIGSKLTWSLFLFIFYCLMIAYISGIGGLTAGFLTELFHVPVPTSIASLLCLLLIGAIIFFGTRRSGQINLFFMGGLILSYALLIACGILHIRTENLVRAEMKSLLPCIPIMLVSFGYHNLVPSLVSYLQRNAKALRLSILLGTTLPFLFYFLWQIVILGIFSAEHTEILSKSDMATELLREVNSSPYLLLFVHLFAFFAIVTSLLANALSSIDFLADGLGLQKTARVKTLLTLSVLLPPFFFALFFSHIFLKALSFAGGFATVILFGILPAAIVWSGRYKKKREGMRLLPGGKLVLGFIFALSFGFLLIEIHQHLHFFRS